MGEWGLGFGDWGLGIGPIPNPQYNFIRKLYKYLYIYLK
jgi:hypothetical protein